MDISCCNIKTQAMHQTTSKSLPLPSAVAPISDLHDAKVPAGVAATAVVVPEDGEVISLLYSLGSVGIFCCEFLTS